MIYNCFDSDTLTDVHWYFVKASFVRHDQKDMASVTLIFFFLLKLYQFVFNRHVTVEKNVLDFVVCLRSYAIQTSKTWHMREKHFWFITKHLFTVFKITREPFFLLILLCQFCSIVVVVFLALLKFTGSG